LIAAEGRANPILLNEILGKKLNVFPSHGLTSTTMGEIPDNFLPVRKSLVWVWKLLPLLH